MTQLALIRRLMCLWPALLVHASAFAFDIDDLRELVRDRQLDTVAEVIEHLPPEYHRNYTLAYDSQSLQGSSFDNPRAILFGRTAGLVLTFNGDPSQAHYDAIEAMQYREDSEAFELYSIEFGDGVPRFAGPNPEVCASCHGSPPHPVWSSYEYGERETSHWPGMYGSSHDAPALDEREKAAFERFRQRAASHPRYRHLKLDDPDAPWFPYAGGPTQHRLRPNNRLGNLLARRHARQIVAMVKRDDFARDHPRLAQAWLLQCPGTGKAAYRERVTTLFEQRFPRREHPYSHALRDSLAPGRQASFMMEKLLTGSDSFGWDMSIEKPENTGRFFTGIATIDELVGARWLATLDADHWLSGYYEPWTNRDLYNTFAPGYYQTNVAPGGVGDAYDEILGYYDEERARQACPDLMRPLLAGAQ
ncbi:MAG TPA: hypothetical protein VK973_09400 [Arenicellales bacterium]|nr:hypothetical protein [Arenicellales bacterium]